MSDSIDKFQTLWHEIKFGRLFISSSWWSRWDETFLKTLLEVEVMLEQEKGPDVAPLTAPRLVRKIEELSKILKAVGTCDDPYNVTEDGCLELGSSARLILRDFIGNDLHKMLIVIDDPGGDISVVERMRNVLRDIKDFIEEFKDLTKEEGL